MLQKIGNKINKGNYPSGVPKNRGFKNWGERDVSNFVKRAKSEIWVYYVFLSIVMIGITTLLLIIVVSKYLKNKGVIKTSVELEPLPEPQLKEKRVSRKDTYNVTLDVENFVRICMSDPNTRDMVFRGIKKGPMLPTEVLGAVNMKENDNDEDNWFSVFAGTSRELIAGQPGFVLRNKGGEGSRVSLRLKRQTAKTHTAQVTQTPGQVILETGDATASLLRDAINGNKEAAVAFLKLADATQHIEQSSSEENITIKL